jgi:phosphatidate cytidylyltransferase
MFSPNKTWAGLIGGAACAAVAGAVAAVFLEKAGWGPLAAVSAGIAVVAQGGDLMESALKRHFGVKDSSAIIPGHGGLLDRVDGLLAASAAGALLGMTGSGGVLAWT